MCYAQHALNNLGLVVLELFLWLGGSIANAFVIYVIWVKSERMVFDIILIGHSIVNIGIALIDLPFYHIFTLLNYWPFGRTSCILWNTFDGLLNTTDFLHMLFMSWCRKRSIDTPQMYRSNFLIRNTKTVLFFSWLVSLTLWLAINLNYNDYEPVKRSCNLKFDSNYFSFMLYFSTWFLPLFLILVISLDVYIRLLLKKKNRVQPFKSKAETTSGITSFSQQKRKIKSCFKLDPQSKLTVIIGIYMAQWMPSCIILVTDSFCKCVPDKISLSAYWLTFNVSFTDAICIIILNTKYFKN